MSTNRLSINISKSNYMLINFSGKNSRDLNLKIGENNINRVKNTKILGIIVDDSLRFKDHIENMCRNINSKIGLLTRLKKFLPKEFLNIIFKATIQPKIDYGITVYGNTFSSHTKRIVKLLNRASRVITSSDKDYDILYNELNWKTFSCRRNYFNNIFIYRCTKKLAPNICNDIFQLKSSAGIRTSSVRNNEVLIPRKYSETFGNTIFWSGLKEFNKLDLTIRNSNNLKSFIRNIRK